jgi:ABC-type nickel/cobalt efflux system permease component RcnA
MFFALTHGVPLAGLTFAAAMLAGIALTLCAVALAAVLARDALVHLLSRHGGSVARLGTVLDAVSGALLLGIGAWEFATLATRQNLPFGLKP